MVDSRCLILCDTVYGPAKDQRNIEYSMPVDCFVVSGSHLKSSVYYIHIYSADSRLSSRGFVVRIVSQNSTSTYLITRPIKVGLSMIPSRMLAEDWRNSVGNRERCVQASVAVDRRVRASSRNLQTEFHRVYSNSPQINVSIIAAADLVDDHQ